MAKRKETVGEGECVIGSIIMQTASIPIRVVKPMSSRRNAPKIPSPDIRVWEAERKTR